MTKSIRDFFSRSKHAKTAVSEAQQQISLFVALLVILFGIGSWISVAGMMVEVPVLIAEGIPEKYKLNSYLSCIAQFAFVGQLLFVLFNRFAPKMLYRPEIPVIYLLTVIAATGNLLLAFLWDSYTVWPIDNKLHSTPFFILFICTSMASITSNSTFTGFMSLLKPAYLNWYWIGHGLGALSPSFIAIVQHIMRQDSCVQNATFLNHTWVGNASEIYNCTTWMDSGPRVDFGPRELFFVLTGIMLLCLISFVGLNILPSAIREHVPCDDGRPAKHDPCGGLCRCAGSAADDEELIPLSEVARSDVPPSETNNNHDNEQRSLSTLQFVCLYTILFGKCLLMYGIMSPIQSFSASAYGQSVYEYVVISGGISKLVGYFLFLIKPICSFTLVVLTFLLGTICAGYGMAVALMSPHPPLQGLVISNILIIACWTGQGLLLSYCKAGIVWILRQERNSRKHLIWSGVIGQVGVVIGTFAMFPVINVFEIFHTSYVDECDMVTCEKISPSSLYPLLSGVED
ncbi:solute carrier family 52, riboflavin transporter, member 3-B-like [Diadema antillarum]|uniref:solute carrier family 52, riboflavin transporter, member 3-B-like n=1 Tax=Diadema antillarum TaxID=105358 RepID=UPI003A848608